MGCLSREDVAEDMRAADDYARLRRYEQRAFHVSQLPGEVAAEPDQVAIPEAAKQFDDEYRP